MSITKVYYCPISLIIPNEWVAQTLEGKLLKRALNMNYTNEAVDIKRYQAYLEEQFLNFFANGGMLGRGGDLIRLNTCELRLNLTLLDIEWGGRFRSIAQFVNDNRKKHILIDDEETRRGIDGATQWAAFILTHNSKYIPHKLRLEFINPNDGSGWWELSEEELTTIDSL